MRTQAARYTLIMNVPTHPPSLAPDDIRTALSSISPNLITDRSLTPSAVLIPVVNAQNDPRILFTVRTAHVEHHKGEVSFPGGARDPDDETIADTAIRETHEEVGIRPEHLRILGRLNDHRTRTGYHITPFVGIVRPGADYDHDRFEVNAVLEVPFGDLWETYLKGPQPFTYGQNRITAYEFRHDGQRIWGATAAILAEFFGVLLAMERT